MLDFETEMFLFACGDPAAGAGAGLAAADIILPGAAYRGPRGAVTRRGTDLCVTWGDPAAAHSRLHYHAASGDLTVTTDASGQMALRCAMLGGRIYVASHDLALAGQVPFAVDDAALALLRRLGWSLGNRSLIRGITVLPAGRTVMSGGQVSHAAPCHPDGGDPVPRMLSFLAGRLPPGPVTVELSAGFDSRAALAATLACKNAADIRVMTEGPPGSRDVAVAETICRRLGLSLTRRRTRPRATRAILADWSLTAARANGHVEVDILASRGPEMPTVCGDGGEIHRGYYDPFRPFRDPPGGPPDRAAAILARCLGRSDRLAARVGDLAAGADSAARVLDLFYLTERFGVWNQKLARDPRQRISPFYAADALTPPGRHDRCAPHLALIRRYLPAALDLPVNGGPSPAMHGPGAAARFARDLAIFRAKLGRRLRRDDALKDSRAAAMAALCGALPEGFLNEPADGWAELGAQRFLRLYRLAAEAAPRPAQVPGPVRNNRPECRLPPFPTQTTEGST